MFLTLQTKTNSRKRQLQLIRNCTFFRPYPPTIDPGFQEVSYWARRRRRVSPSALITEITLIFVRTTISSWSRTVSRLHTRSPERGYLILSWVFELPSLKSPPLTWPISQLKDWHDLGVVSHFPLVWRKRPLGIFLFQMINKRAMAMG